MTVKPLPTNNYRRGRAFEHAVIKQFKADPDTVLVVRSAGSRGPADIVVIRSCAPPVLLVQCKTTGMPTEKERIEFARIARETAQSTAVVAWKAERKTVYAILDFSGQPLGEPLSFDQLVRHFEEQGEPDMPAGFCEWSELRS